MTVDKKDIDNLEKGLKQLNNRGLPFAIRSTLTRTAIDTRKLIVYKTLKDFFTIRNHFTERGMRYNKATGSNVDRMFSEVGSVSDYMAKQETGFTVRSNGKHGVPVPTAGAAGQTGRRRTRTIRRPMYVSNINLPSGPSTGTTTAQGRIVAVREAIKQKRRIIFGEFGDTKGFWRIKGGTIGRSTSGWPKGTKLSLIYSMDKKLIKSKRRQWLETATDEGIERLPDIYVDELIKQIDFVMTPKGLTER